MTDGGFCSDSDHLKHRAERQLRSVFPGECYRLSGAVWWTTAPSKSVNVDAAPADVRTQATPGVVAYESTEAGTVVGASVSIVGRSIGTSDPSRIYNGSFRAARQRPRSTRRYGSIRPTNRSTKIQAGT